MCIRDSFKRGQTGSSAMPHKRNPILSERLTGMSRLLRGYALSGLVDQALWHDRDISHSSVERVALPGATALLLSMLQRFRLLGDGLVVRPERMAENIERGLGLHCSSRVLTTLVEAGLERPRAYAIVQRHALRAFDERIDFRGLIEADPEVTAVLTPEAIGHCFDDRAWLIHVKDVIARLERLDP